MEQHTFCPLFSDSFISAFGLSKVSSSSDVAFIWGVSSVSGPLLYPIHLDMLFDLQARHALSCHSEIQC